MNTFLKLLLILIPILSVTAEESEELNLPKNGVLAGSTGLPSGTNDDLLNAPFAGEDLNSKEPNPITGSIKNTGNQNYEYSISNTTEDLYNLKISIKQVSKTGAKLQSYNRNVSLSAGKTLTGKFKANPQTSNVSLNLNSWKQKKAKKSSDEILALIEQKKAEIAELEKKFPGNSLKTKKSKPDFSTSSQPKEKELPRRRAGVVE